MHREAPQTFHLRECFLCLIHIQRSASTAHVGEREGSIGHAGIGSHLYVGNHAFARVLIGQQGTNAFVTFIIVDTVDE